VVLCDVCKWVACVNKASSFQNSTRADAEKQPHILLGDIGATNARFAELTAGQLSQMKSFEVAAFRTFEEVVQAFVDGRGSDGDFTNALFAVAGPIESGRSTLTNTSWIVDPRQLSNSFGFDVQIVNDFQAVAHSLPALTPADLRGIGGGKSQEGAPRGVLGPGSGLGVACCIETSGYPLVVPSEGGHSTLAGNNDREDAILRNLRQRFGHASAERALSGPGLENIYQAIARLDGHNLAQATAAEITRRALNHESEPAYEALSIFCALLGSFAGNVALTFNARGGIYIAGGISPRIVDFLISSEFRVRFEAKGRFRHFLERIPCFIIIHPAAAFLGLKALTEEIQSGDGDVS
jgi:glucokinase